MNIKKIKMDKKPFTDQLVKLLSQSAKYYEV